MLRFISKGGAGTDIQVQNAETGEDVLKTLSIAYDAKITLGQIITAECRLAMVEVDVTPETTEFHTKNPTNDRYEPVRAIEFRDGTRVEIAEDGTPSVVKL